MAEVLLSYTFTSIYQSPMMWEKKAQISIFLTGDKNVTLFSCITGNGLNAEIKEFWTEPLLLKLHHLL